MKYNLWTGATGLLGAYLLRDSLAAGRRLAVLVRPTRLETARQRVESILARFENEIECPLPRPVVLEGDLAQPAAGLDSDAQRWVAENCDRALHNAASLTFYRDEKTGEPRRTNVDGTRHLLELCHATGIRQFDFVSTAYVAGLRSGVCLESELDVGQEFGNDYERSKVEAEKLVRAADFLDAPNFYRPAIIIGDSRTGYTSTYHGFFTPLKIARAVVGNADLPAIDGSPILSALGLSGDERKNFVPVDWISAVITYLLGRPDCRGQTYHLVPRNLVTVKTAARVFEDALRRFRPTQASASAPGGQDWSFAPKLFREQMSMYRSYWRDDPEYDYRNTTAAAPHLPCPTVHYAMLMRMAMFALESGFGWPRPKPSLPPCDVAEQLARLPRPNHAAGDRSVVPVGLQINGRGGGQWTLLAEAGAIRAVDSGLPTDERPLLYLNSETFHELAVRATTVPQALESGAVHVELGHGVDALNRGLIEAVLESLTQ